MDETFLADNVFFYALFILVLAPLGMMFLECLLIASVQKAFFDKQGKENMQESEQEIEELTPRIDKAFTLLSPYLVYVPKNYRTSSALRYFVESYENSRVDNLKEEINAYDTYVFRQDVKEGFKQVDRRLEAIEYLAQQSLAMLHELNDSIWLSSFYF